MKTRIFAVIAIALIATSLLAADKTEPATKAANSWLALVDAGKYGESWDESASIFRNAIAKSGWESAIRGVRGPLGEVKSRKLKSATYATSLPGAPDGEYVVVQFDTVFANKAQAVETITPMLDKDGKWRVSGYYIK